MNPLGMVVALLGAMDHAASLDPKTMEQTQHFTKCCQAAAAPNLNKIKGI